MTISTGNPRRDYVYQKIEELGQAIEQDSFNLSYDKQNSLITKLQQFKEFVDKTYAKKTNDGLNTNPSSQNDN